MGEGGVCGALQDLPVEPPLLVEPPYKVLIRRIFLEHGEGGLQVVGEVLVGVGDAFDGLIWVVVRRGTGERSELGV